MRGKSRSKRVLIPSITSKEVFGGGNAEGGWTIWARRWESVGMD